MSVRRRTGLVASCLALTLGCSVPALADPSPTPGQLRAARERVASAAGRVGDLQARAEAAAEAYNGAVTRAQAAALASSRATGQAVAAGALFDAARRDAASAVAAAGAAAAAAAARTAEQHAAQAQAVVARQDLDNLANGAYRSGGELTMLAMLMNASGPAELGRGRDLMAVVARNQEHTIGVARAASTLAARRAVDAASAATATWAARTHAADVLAHVDELQQVAVSSSRAAADAARAATQGLAAAAASRRTAQQLVTQAESVLGSARATAASLAASLARAAAAARRAALAVHVPVARSVAAQTAMSWALGQIGTPYSWGGGDANGPTFGFAQGANTRGFDCSGLTLFAYGKAGIALDHYTGSQYNQGLRVSRFEDLQPGDLMFFATDLADESTIHHVAIYLGNGQMVEAPHTGDVVKVSPARRGDFFGGTRPWA